MVVGGASSSPVRDATSRSHKEEGTFGDDNILFTLTHILYMRNAFWILVFLTGTIIGFGCTDRKVREQLNEAERLIMTSPDSALHIIDDINMDGLRESKDKALYGLLYTMALDKNHMPLTNDSIINFSVDYYKRTVDKLHLAMSLYYCGRVLQQTGHISSALVSYLQAIDAAEEIGNKFYVGMACRGMSDIYSDSFNAGDELAYAKREYENIKEAGIQPYINYAMYDLATAYQSNGKYKEVYELTREFGDSALKANDSFLYEIALRLGAKAYIGDDKPKEAIKSLNILCQNGSATSSDSLYLAACLALINETDRSESILSQTHSNDSILNALANFHVSYAKEDIKNALNYSDELDRLTNDSLQRVFNKSLSTTIADFYGDCAKRDKEKIEMSNRIVLLSILLALISIGIVVFAAYNIISNQRKKIEEKVNFAEELQESISRYRERDIITDEKIKKILAGKYELLVQLCEIVQRSKDTKTARRAIANKVSSLIDEISISDNKIQEFADEIDSGFNNLFSDYKHEFPMLKDIDYRLFIFSVLDFPHIVTCLLLRIDDQDKVYDRKRRLRDKIRKLDEAKAKRFLSFMH